MAKCGLMYIVSGDEFIEEAAVSAKSAKQVMPDVSIAVVTDRQIDHDCFDDIILLDKSSWRHDFGDHVAHLDKSPYEKTIKCDSDIYFDEPVNDVFDLLDEFDVAAAQAPLRHSTNRIDIPELEEVPESFPEYQGGLIGFKSGPEFEEFLSKWRGAYQSTLEIGEESNQASLRAALYKSNCRIATLPREYNCLFRMPGCVNGKVKVFHGRLIETGGKGAPKRADVEEAVETLNSETGLRAYYRSGRTVKIAKENIIMEAIDSVRRNGIVYTIRRGAERLRNRLNTPSN